MTDTPAEIKKLQLKIWQSKTPAERLLLTLQSNEELYLFWKEAKEKMNKDAKEKKQ